MVSSIYRIAEQCQANIKGVDIQTIIAAVTDCLGVVAKNQWYENKQDSVSEVDGVFLYTFGIAAKLTPLPAASTGLYCITIPTAVIRLPNEMGINNVAFLATPGQSFYRVSAGNFGMWSGLKAYEGLSTTQLYFVIGNKMYFPEMTAGTASDILLTLAVAYTGIDVREELNIPPDVINQVVLLVNQRFGVADTSKN